MSHTTKVHHDPLDTSINSPSIAHSPGCVSGELKSAASVTGVLRDKLMLTMSQFATAACAAVRTEATLEQAKERALIVAAFNDYTKTQLTNMKAIRVASESLKGSEDQLIHFSKTTGGAAGLGMGGLFSSISGNRRLLQDDQETVIRQMAENKVAFKMAAEKAATGVAVFREWAHGKAKSFAKQEQKLREYTSSSSHLLQWLLALSILFNSLAMYA